jgi:hypothetical protein
MGGVRGKFGAPRVRNRIALEKYLIKFTKEEYDEKKSASFHDIRTSIQQATLRDTFSQIKPSRLLWTSRPSGTRVSVG